MKLFLEELQVWSWGEGWELGFFVDLGSRMSIYSVKDESKKVGFKRGGWHQRWIRE